MKVLVDTCIWSKALRYKEPDLTVVKKLTTLIENGQAVIIGPIKQEILSGIPDKQQFEKLKKLLRAYEEIPLTAEMFEKGAEFCNICRGKGVQGSTIDFLICSVAALKGMAVYTDDKDFKEYVKHIPFKLFT